MKRKDKSFFDFVVNLRVLGINRNRLNLIFQSVRANLEQLPSRMRNLRLGRKYLLIYFKKYNTRVLSHKDFKCLKKITILC